MWELGIEVGQEGICKQRQKNESVCSSWSAIIDHGERRVRRDWNEKMIYEVR